MALEIIEIGVKDNIVESRPIINSNFAAVKEEIDSIENVINIEDGSISANSMVVTKGSNPTSTEIMTVEASASFDGGISVTGTIQGSNVHLSNTAKLTVVGGNVNLTGESSNLNIEGNANFSGRVVLKNFGNTILSGSNTGTYSNVTSNVGTLVPGNRHGVILDFSNYSSSANISNTNNVKEFKLDTPTEQGQVFIVTINAYGSTGKPHNVLANNIVSLGGSQKISFQEDYGVATFIASGNSWILTSLLKANIV